MHGQRQPDLQQRVPHDDEMLVACLLKGAAGYRQLHFVPSAIESRLQFQKPRSRARLERKDEIGEAEAFKQRLGDRDGVRNFRA